MAARKLRSDEIDALVMEVARSYGTMGDGGKRMDDDGVMERAADLYRARCDPRYRGNLTDEYDLLPAVIICDSPYQMQDKLHDLWERGLLPSSITDLSDVDYAFPREYSGELAYLHGCVNYLGGLYLLCGSVPAEHRLAAELQRNVLSELIWQDVEGGVREYARGKGQRYFMVESDYAPLSRLEVASIALLKRAIDLADPENEVLPRLNFSRVGPYFMLFKAGLWPVLFLRYAIVACRAPTVALFDDQQRLHSVDGPALVWGDGMKQYRVHGVPYDEDTWDRVFRERSATVQEVMALRDRAAIGVALRHIGWDRVLEQVGCVVLDEMRTKNARGEPLTYQLVEAFLGDDAVYSDMSRRSVPVPARFVRVQCPTTMKTSVLRVNPMDPMTRTCKGAIAWTFGMAEKEYAPVVES